MLQENKNPETVVIECYGCLAMGFRNKNSKEVVAKSSSKKIALILCRRNWYWNEDQPWSSKQ